MELVTNEVLQSAYKEAMEGMYIETPIKKGSKFKQTIECESCTAVVGKVEDAHGRQVQVTITVQADEDEWI